MRVLGAFCVLIALIFALPAHAEERIVSYDVTIDVQKNADLIVTESITVISEGRSIKRGIFRDLPRFKLDDGDTIPYQYTILSVTKDGAAEPFDDSNDGNAKRVRIGDADVFLKNGTHRYEIQYRVKNEIRYGDTRDELYWNVTGNYWKFPIEQARASIILPRGTRSSAVSEIQGYAGRLGTKNVPTRVGPRFDPIIIETMRRLEPLEGLTISVSLDKGVIAPPTTVDKTRLWWFKNGALFLLSFSFTGLFAYYYRAWHKVGRDPAKRPVYARYAPPEGYSAAAVDKLSNRLSGSHDALIATLMSLAVKGAIHIDSGKKKTVLKYRGLGEADTKLLEDERKLFERLFNKRSLSLTLSGKHSKEFTAAHTAFNKHIEKKYGDDYFRWNAGHTILGVVLSLLAIAASISQLYGHWKTGFIALFVALIVLNFVFLFLMPAPTQKGRDVTSEIEGFKLYLKTAESNRFAKHISQNVAHAPPTMTQELYERYLPYAVALDVEKPWSKYFEAMLPEEAANYSPVWGHSYNARGGARGFTKSLSSNLSSGVSTALPQSSSSSGGGGGFSGGGGGGGGGGGW